MRAMGAILGSLVVKCGYKTVIGRYPPSYCQTDEDRRETDQQ